MPAFGLQEGIVPAPGSKRDPIRQHRHTAVVCLNVAPGTTRPQLLDGFERLAERIRVLKAGKPEREHEPWLIKGSVHHLTATWGYGGSLFDRPDLGLGALRPRGLRRMPDFPHEERDPDFAPAQGAADLLVQFSSSHVFALFRAVNSVTKPGRLPFTLAGYHAGFQRSDDRGMLRFFDGTSNLSPDERKRLVPVDAATQGELPWCDKGTFMVFRKLREEVREWEALDQAEQEQRIGRRKVDGFPLGAPAQPASDDPTFRNPDYQGANRAVPVDSHIRKMNPRQGVDPNTKVFRRGWPYFDGFAPDGRMRAGLLFVSFQRDLGSFEIIRQSWMPPGFPNGAAQADGILRARAIHLVTGGYYFIPRAPSRREAFPGAGALGPVLSAA